MPAATSYSNMTAFDQRDHSAGVQYALHPPAPGYPPGLTQYDMSVHPPAVVISEAAGMPVGLAGQAGGAGTVFFPPIAYPGCNPTYYYTPGPTLPPGGGYVLAASPYGPHGPHPLAPQYCVPAAYGLPPQPPPSEAGMMQPAETAVQPVAGESEAVRAVPRQPPQRMPQQTFGGHHPDGTRRDNHIDRSVPGSALGSGGHPGSEQIASVSSGSEATTKPGRSSEFPPTANRWGQQTEIPPSETISPPDTGQWHPPATTWIPQSVYYTDPGVSPAGYPMALVNVPRHAAAPPPPPAQPAAIHSGQLLPAAVRDAAVKRKPTYSMNDIVRLNEIGRTRAARALVNVSMRTTSSYQFHCRTNLFRWWLARHHPSLAIGEPSPLDKPKKDDESPAEAEPLPAVLNQCYNVRLLLSFRGMFISPNFDLGYRVEPIPDTPPPPPPSEPPSDEMLFQRGKHQGLSACRLSAHLPVRPAHSIGPTMRESWSEGRMARRRDPSPVQNTATTLPSRGRTKIPSRRNNDLTHGKNIGHISRGLLNKLSIDKFEKIADEICQRVLCCASSYTDIEILAEEVFSKAVHEKNYSEMYADLTLVLVARSKDFASENDPPVSGVKPRTLNFKQAFITRCQDEYNKLYKVDEFFSIPEEMDEEEMEYEMLKRRNRLVGNMRFIGELINRKVLPVKILCQIANALLLSRKFKGESDSGLLGSSDDAAMKTNPPPDITTPADATAAEPSSPKVLDEATQMQNEALILDCVIEVITMTGLRIDKDNRYSPVLDTWMSRLKELQHSKILPMRLDFKIQDLVDLRKQNYKKKAIRNQTEKAQTLMAIQQMIKHEQGRGGAVKAIQENKLEEIGKESNHPYKEYVRRCQEVAAKSKGGKKGN